MNTHFKIVVPFYNVERWAKATAKSIMVQDYDNFECVMIDDMSEDKSMSIMADVVGEDVRFKFIKNEEKKHALGNTVQGIEYLKPNHEDVIMVLDGDDWFANSSVLARLDKEYSTQNCWMTYGSYVEYPSGIRGKFAQQLPAQIIEDGAYRQHPWCTSQLRTFKYHLWKDIKPESLRDDNGKLYTITGDLAYMFPMLEMTGDRSRYIKDIVYIYNVETPLNDHKKDNKYQMFIENRIRNQPKYAVKETNEIL